MRNPRGILRIAAFAATALVLAIPSQAYYHYVHFLTGGNPYVPVPEAFDLTALPNKTVTFFVSDSGPVTYGPNDSFASVLSQVKQAAAAWNAIASSDLRVSFAGVESSINTATATPGADVVFQDLPPGLLGMGTPVVSASAVVQTGQNGPFIPIARGLVMLTNTTDPKASYGPGPSYLEEFYTTAVHELGHALGLQHTWTASAMSQDVIRNTSRARPIDADDVAAICELYGKANWTAGFGSISGQVTLAGQGVNLASVVAIPPFGPAVSALTNPDGTYTINGLPPGSYLLYVHPLPPDAAPADGTGLILPVDARGVALGPRNGYFGTEFYPGTTDTNTATLFSVAAGQAFTNQNFTVQARSSVPIYDVVTYCYLDPVSRTYSYNYDEPVSIWMTPAFAGTAQGFLRAYVQANSGPTPTPTSATLLGPGVGAAVKIQAWSGYDVLDFDNQGGITPGPRHMVLTFSDDIYVLPDAMTVVSSAPPTIDSLTTNTDGTVTVAATGLQPDSRVFFDGLQAAITTPFNTAGVLHGAVTVMPPQGASGQTSTLTIYNADNQNSMFLQAANPVTFAYPAANAPQLAALAPSALPAGSNIDGTAAAIDITTTGTNFVEGQVTVGFGSSDISVRRVWVLGPTHLIVDVTVADNGVVGATSVCVISGFQVIYQPAAFQIQPATGYLPTLALPVFNAANYATQLHAGDYAAVFGMELAAPSTAQVTLNGAAVPVIYASPGQVNFQVPAGFPAGPATLVVNNGSAGTRPVLLQIDVPAPVIQSVTNAAGVAIDSTQVVSPGDIVTVLASNIDPAVVNAPSRLRVTLSGVTMTLLSVTQAGAAATGQPASSGTLQLQFAVTQAFGGSQIPLVVYADGSPSVATLVTAR